MAKAEISATWELRLADTTGFARFVKSLPPPVKQRTLEASIDKILLIHGPELVDGDLIKNLGGGLYEYRVGPTTTRMMKRAGEGGTDVHQKIALRVFLSFEGSRLITILGSYDKGANDSKSKQQSAIANSRRLLRAWRGS
jgi:hypothetical protein